MLKYTNLIKPGVVNHPVKAAGKRTHFFCNYSAKCQEVQLFVCLTKFEATNRDCVKDISKLAKSWTSPE